MKKILAILAVLAAALTFTLVSAAPAEAVWSAQRCKQTDFAARVCLQVNSSASGNSRQVTNTYVCLYGEGPYGGLVQRATDNRIKIQGSGGAFLGQEYFGDLSRGNCMYVPVSPGVSGGNQIQVVWTGKQINNGWDNLFSICNVAATGAAC